MSGAAGPSHRAPSGSESWCIGSCLAWTQDYFARRGLPSPRLDAEVLLAQALGVPRVYLYTHPERPLEAGEREAFRRQVKRRAVGEPVAYIVGEREFFGRAFRVDARVLIPRPETEHVVEAALAALGALTEDEAPRVHDVGCGSGALAITLALENPGLVVTASDISLDALAVADENARALAESARSVGRLRFFAADVLDGVDTHLAAIVSNPPYIARGDAADLPVDVRDFEPDLALFAGDDGLEVLARLIERAPHHLRPGGVLVTEMGAAQADAVRGLFARQPGWQRVSITPDLQGHRRAASCRWQRATTGG